MNNYVKDIGSRTDGIEFITEAAEAHTETFYLPSIIFNTNGEGLARSFKKENIEVGSLLLSFISTDFCDYSEYKKFINDWGYGGFIAYSETLNNVYKMKNHLTKIYSKDEYEQLLNTSWKELSTCLTKIREEFYSLLYYSLDVNGPEWTEGLTAYQRYYIYVSRPSFKSEWIDNIDFRMKYSFEADENIPEYLLAKLTIAGYEDPQMISIDDYAKLVKNYNFKFIEACSSNNIRDIMFLEFKKMLINNAIVRRCKYCYNYFIPINRSDAEYCNRVVKSYKGIQKTCKDVGPKKLYAESISSDPIKTEYFKRYKTMHARVNSSGKKGITKPQFQEWAGYANKMYEKAKAGQISLEEFIECLYKE